ncbi:MAG: TetR/AcrR family transcriptional regulator [Solirubrobacteraceae bacterium]
MSTPTRARRVPAQARSRRTVRRILEAAERLVAEEGVDAATTRAIAERAGVAAPSLYRFFADRDEVLDALLEQMVDDLDEHARAGEATWEPGDLEGLLRLEFDLHVSYYEDHPSLAALWFGGRASPAVVESVRRRNHELARRVRELLVARGLVRTDTPVEVFDLVTELGDRILEVAFRDPREPDRKVLELGVAALSAFVERWAA